MYSPQVILGSSEFDELVMKLLAESVQERNGCVYWKGKCMRLASPSKFAFQNSLTVTSRT